MPNQVTYMTNKTFGEALEALKSGNKVARNGWNGKGMFVFLVPGSRFKVSRPPLLGIYPEGTEVQYHAHIDMKTADGQVVPWLASQTDVLAEDWVVLQMRILYSKPNCPACVKLKSEYQHAGIPYIEVVIGRDITVEQFKNENPWVKSVPFVKES